MNTATQPGAADPDVKIGEVVVKPNPRQVAIDAMSERVETERRKSIDEAVAADPGLAENQHRIESEIEASNAAAIADGLLAPAELEDGAASVTPMHEPEPEPVADPLPAELAEDPLSEFIVMKDGKPMFLAKVNGEDKLLPLDQARRQIQIGTAADIRMQQATAFQKNTTRDLDERERAVVIKETALAQRMAAVPEVPAVPVQADLSYEDILEETKDIFNTAFSGTEEDAAKKLATTLLKLRGPAQLAPVQQIDEAAIEHRAAKAAVTAIQNVNKTKDVKTGYEQFQTDYPEIMSDPNLYKMADDMTDVIEEENPDWEISQVMDEAGKRTRAWVNQIKGVDPEPELDPNPTPAKPNAPVLAQHPTQNRQERKAELVRMPHAAAAAVHQTPGDEPEEEQSPQEAFAELKAGRGQPT